MARLGSVQKAVLESIRDHGDPHTTLAGYPKTHSYAEWTQRSTLAHQALKRGLVKLLPYNHPDVIAGGKQWQITTAGHQALGMPKDSSAQKSESRAATLARGILAAVELRKAHYGTGRGKYPRPWKDKQSGRMHQDLTHLLPEQYHATHSMEASWLPGMPQHVSAKVTYKHPSYGTSEALGFTSHGGSKEWYEGSGAASQHSKAHEIQPHADAAFGRFLQSKMMAPHHPDRG